MSSEPAHIAMDGRTLCAGQIRGIGSYIQQLMQRIPPLCPHQFSLYHDRATPVRADLLPARFRERQVRARGSRFFLWEQLALPLALRRDGVQLFHSPGNTLPVFQPCPFVLTLHDVLLLHIDDDETPRGLWYWRRLLPRAMRRAARIITASEFSRRDIVQSLGIPEERIVVIPHAMDPIFSPSGPSERGDGPLPREGFILVLGAAAPRKNTLRALEAFACLKRRGFEGVRLVVSGVVGDLEDRVRQRARDLGVAADVEILGFVSQETLRLLYGRAGLFLYPSAFEGFGLPILEAMACGAPVVASNRTSIPEVVGDAGILCDPDEPEEMARGLARVLCDEGLARELRTRGLKRAANFSWETSARRTLEVYEDVLFRGGKTGASAPRT